MPLQELLGVVGAGEWRRTGIDVPALGARIHPHHGVFAPSRRNYVELVAAAPLPPVRRVFDEGGRMLRGFLLGLSDHLAEGGEAWLVLSDLAERLGLRSRDDLPALVAWAGLSVRGRLDAPRAPCAVRRG